MSAPKTNVEKQAKRHRPALTGIALAAAFGVAIIAALGIWQAYSTDAPEGAESQLELGGSGEVEPAE